MANRDAPTRRTSTWHAITNSRTMATSTIAGVYTTVGIIAESSAEKRDTTTLVRRQFDGESR